MIKAPQCGAFFLVIAFEVSQRIFYLTANIVTLPNLLLFVRQIFVADDIAIVIDDEIKLPVPVTIMPLYECAELVS